MIGWLTSCSGKLVEMVNVRYFMRGDELVIKVAGRIDANNARTVEQECDKALLSNPCSHLVFDLEELEHISSAGLRVLLRFAKRVDEMRIENANPAVYDVFEMTGFSELFEVKKALRHISVEGCTIIGRGAKGAVYRIDPETVVKVSYDSSDEALGAIANERELARAAFVMGIPTAISYDVVRVGEYYGAVYELLDASTLGELLSSGEWSEEEVAKAMAGLLAQIHETQTTSSQFSSALDWQLRELELLEGRIPADLYERIVELCSVIPEDGRLIHGDFHLGNIMEQDGELLLIDMDTLAKGNAVLELGPMYNAFVGFGELDHSIIEDFQGITYELSCKLWSDLISGYCQERGLDAGSINLKAEIMGRIRQLRRIIAHGDENTAHGQRVMEHNCKALPRLLSQVEILVV